MRTIPSMAIPAKPQVTLSDRDREALEALMNELPQLEEAGAASLVRTLMRLGFIAFAQSPLFAMRVTEPPPTEWIVAAVKAAVDRENSDATIGPATLGAMMRAPAADLPPEHPSAGPADPKPHHAHPVTPTGKAKGLKVPDEPLMREGSDEQLQKNQRAAQNQTSKGRLRSDPKK